MADILEELEALAKGYAGVDFITAKRLSLDIALIARHHSGEQACTAAERALVEAELKIREISKRESATYAEWEALVVEERKCADAVIAERAK